MQLEYQKISNRLLLEEPKKPWYLFWKKWARCLCP
jgi:hypothetical protein